MRNFFTRQEAWVKDVEARAEGRAAEISKRSAALGTEKVRNI